MSATTPPTAPTMPIEADEQALRRLVRAVLWFGVIVGSVGPLAWYTEIYAARQGYSLLFDPRSWMTVPLSLDDVRRTLWGLTKFMGMCWPCAALLGSIAGLLRARWAGTTLYVAGWMGLGHAALLLIGDVLHALSDLGGGLSAAALIMATRLLTTGLSACAFLAVGGLRRLRAIPGGEAPGQGFEVLVEGHGPRAYAPERASSGAAGELWPCLLAWMHIAGIAIGVVTVCLVLRFLPQSVIGELPQTAADSSALRNAWGAALRVGHFAGLGFIALLLWGCIGAIRGRPWGRQLVVGAGWLGIAAGVITATGQLWWAGIYPGLPDSAFDLVISVWPALVHGIEIPLMFLWAYSCAAAKEMYDPARVR